MTKKKKKEEKTEQTPVICSRCQKVFLLCKCAGTELNK